MFTLLSVIGVSAQQIELKGSVKDTKGEPILGAFVLIKGTNRGATTDMEGNYNLRVQVGDVLHFSFLGMKTEDKKVTAGTTHIDVVMRDDVQQLEGTVVVGYGKRKVASRTVANIAQVAGKDIAQTPVPNVLESLQGRVAGMIISTNSGRPDATSTVRIHGIGSFSAAVGDRSGSISDVLYVVDGVQVDASIMSAINPSDIENISVLKDAASTSIYGARAANGVILITTKRGKRNERTSITINHQLGFSALTNASRKFFDGMVTPREYMDFWLLKDPDEVKRIGDAIDGNPTDAATAAQKILTKYPYNTRWDKVFYRDFVPLSRTDVSVSGGSNTTSYYLSLGYLNQEGTKKRSDYERYNLNLNLDSQITTWLRSGLSVTLAHSDAETTSGGNAGDIMQLPLYSPTDENGKRKNYIYSFLTLPDPDSNKTGFYHPDYLIEKNPGNAQVDEILPTGYLTIEPIKNLTFKTQVGIQYNIEETVARGLASSYDYENDMPNVASTQCYLRKNIQTTYTNFIRVLFYVG
ncbi:hypothetical protein RCZ04_00790 [Capnocytophaga sp. HP1101]